MYFVAVLAVILAVRESGWIRIHLPECKRQTEKLWAHQFGFVTASAMWGFHIGFGFATRITYGGFYILVATVFALGDSMYGVAVMLAYWLGRTMPVWLGPWLIAADQKTEELPEAVLYSRSLHSRLAVLSFLWSAVVAGLYAYKS
jgi:cytochrome c biogenesis protein CcdA